MPHGQVAQYIGMTQNTLSKRLTFHLQQGSILEHFRNYHHEKLTRNILTNNTKIIDRENKRHGLLIKEALHIQEKSPEINIQNNNFTNVLKLFTTHDRASNNFNQTKEIKENDNSFNIFDVCAHSTPIPNTMVDLNLRFKKLLDPHRINYTNEINNDNSPIASRLRSSKRSINKNSK